MDFLGLGGKAILVTGIANKKSVAWFIGRSLIEAGARPIFTVRTEERREQTRKLLGDHPVHVCDVTNQDEIEALAEALGAEGVELAGLVHSMAWAGYERGLAPFHETTKEDFLRSVDVSCYSLINLSNALNELFAKDASVVTISISTTTMAAENYGYMAPIKAALDSAVVFLAKSFSAFSDVRFNAVKAGPLKTSSSSGIPGYVESYLYAERATLRHRALETQEVADAALFLLSNRSSGINAQGLVLDCGMGRNFFDAGIVGPAMHPGSADRSG